MFYRFPFPTVLNRRSVKNVTLKLFLGLFGVATFIVPANAGWVWDGRPEGAYAGTGAQWIADESLEGKWVKSGTVIFTDGTVDVAKTDNALTIDSATLTFSGNARIAIDDKPAYVTVQNGGILNMTKGVTISDASGISEGYLKIDAGTVNSTGEFRLGYHNNAYVEVINGGTLTTNSMRIGGAGNRLGSGHLVIGNLDASKDTGNNTVSIASNVQVSATKPQEITINRGMLSINGTIFLGGDTDVVETPSTVTLDVNQFGTLTTTQGISSANRANVTTTINVNGGTMSTRDLLLSVGSGHTILNIENGTENNALVNAQNTISVGQIGTAIMNLKSGTVDASLNEAKKDVIIGGSGNSTHKGIGTANIYGGLLKANTVYIGGGDAGSALNIYGGEVLANVNVGFQSQAEMTMTGGKVAGNINIINTSTANISNGEITGRIDIGNNNGLSTLNFGNPSATTPGTVTVRNGMNIGNGSGASHVSIQNATVKVINDLNIGVDSSENVVLDVGKGGVLIAASAKSGLGTTSPTINVHDGGKILPGSGTRFLIGDKAGNVNYVSVLGEGSEIRYDGSASGNFAFGFHGTAHVTIGEGGKIAGGSMVIGNGDKNISASSTATIYGKGMIQLTGTAQIGNGGNQDGCINMLVSEGGPGFIDAKTITFGTGSMINIDIDQGAVFLRDYPDAGYDIIRTQSNLDGRLENQSDILTVTTGDADADGYKRTNVSLDESKKRPGILLTGSRLDDPLGLGEAGWVETRMGGETKLQLDLTGLDTLENTQLLADWFMMGMEQSYTATATGINTVTLTDVLIGDGVFAWDFTNFNEMNDLNASLSGMTAYVPEPATWMILLLGAFGVFACRRRTASQK